MSRFHTFVRNASSSESEEEGELIDDNDEPVGAQEVEQQNGQQLDIKSLKPSKSLQIVDKIDTKRNNRFSIWSDYLMEEELNHSVSNAMDIKKKKKRRRKALDRESENYSFWTKRELEGNPEDSKSTQNTSKDSSVNESKIKRKKTKKKKKEKQKEEPKERKIDFALEMARKLQEPKVDLMRKTIEALGQEKTAELCAAALDVESAGGLMTADGKRRRTPGGVFFQLLKSDANISKDSIDLIFSDQQKRRGHQIKKKQKKKKDKKSNHDKRHENRFDFKVMEVENQLNQSLSMN